MRPAPVLATINLFLQLIIAKTGAGSVSFNIWKKLFSVKGVVTNELAIKNLLLYHKLALVVKVGGGCKAHGAQYLNDTIIYTVGLDFLSFLIDTLRVGHSKVYRIKERS